MENNILVESSFSATINAPIHKVDIPCRCLTLPESEYQACSPAHCSAGATAAPDGRRMQETPLFAKSIEPHALKSGNGSQQLESV
jgi:hypothetical protein